MIPPITPIPITPKVIRNATDQTPLGSGALSPCDHTLRTVIPKDSIMMRQHENRTKEPLPRESERIHTERLDIMGIDSRGIQPGLSPSTFTQLTPLFLFSIRFSIGRAFSADPRV